MTSERDRYRAVLYRQWTKRELEDGPMVSAADLEKARAGLYKRIETKVSRYWFALVLGALLTIGSSIAGFVILRGNGKASEADMKTVEAKVQDTSERCRALETRQMTIADDVKEVRDDVKEILERLPK